MEKHRVKAKFHNGRIVCVSQILCTDCPEKKNCEDIDIYIDGKYEGSRACMSHDSHKRENRRMKQQRWEK